MRLKTLIFSGVIAVLISSPVLAYGGHSLFIDTHNTKRIKESTCDKGYGPKHQVHLVITHNKKANQTYALSACGLNGYVLRTQIRMNGTWGPEVEGNGWTQTKSLCEIGDLCATEVHKIVGPIKK